MKAIFSLRKHSYLKTIGTFIIAIALIAGVAGCTPTVTYALTMAESPAGGGTATDETGGSPYAEGDDVSIKAVAAAGYEFDSWTAPAGTFADASAATTTFTMPAQDVTVTANFVLVYDLTMAENPAVGGTATDETGTSPYAEGDDVSIKAVAAAGYEFDSWTAPAGTFADASAATTTFTMPAQDVTVTANFVLVYDLTMAENPAVGGTATDETGTSPYQAGTVVDIEAVAADCYRFVNWQAPAGTFGDANNPTTTFTMPASDVTVTANFEEVPPDHFKFYSTQEGAPYIGEEVQLQDQFGTFNATVGYAISFGNPVEKEHPVDVVTPIEDEDRHYTLYELDYGEGEPMLDSWQVMVNNQFQDDVWLTVVGPVALAVPTEKEGHEAPVCLDHLLVYEVVEAEFPEVGVHLTDQFTEEDVVVWGPDLFANPVHKTAPGAAAPTPIEHEDEHYVFYYIEGEPFEKNGLQITNQFGPQTLDLVGPELLAVPSQKIDWGQPLDHFKTYWADWGEEPPMYEVPVQLEDQFVTIDAVVYEPWLFANPTNKGHEVWTPVSNWDNHLTFYYIVYDGDPQVWEVTVNNQFGNDQVLYIEGPHYLAVPTGKLAPDWPADLNHFLVYDVVDSAGPIMAEVYIEDQFIEGWTNVYEPEYFAIPAQKTHPPGGPVTPIVDDVHLVFYVIGGIYYWDAYDLPVVNQFGEQYLDLVEGEGNFLGVPSDKTDWDGPWIP